MTAARPGVFLDRDGCVVDELGFLVDADATRLLPGAAAAVARLNRAGIPVVLVTNQSAVARGLLDEDGLARIHARMAELLAAEDAHLDLVLHCPHHPEFTAACPCRKPEPGMLLEGAERLGLDLERSWMVGDAARDLEAGRRAGVGGLVLLATGKGAREHTTLTAEGLADYLHRADLRAAVEDLLRPPAPPSTEGTGPQGR